MMCGNGDDAYRSVKLSDICCAAGTGMNVTELTMETMGLNPEIVVHMGCTKT